MAPLVFVEVLARNDQVTLRQAIDTLPCNLGRSYGNQVILDDPFVHPCHARIDRAADGTLTWTDLVRNVTTPIDPVRGSHCTIGRTKLRLRTPAFELEATRAEPLKQTRIGRLAGSRSGRALALTSGFACFLANAHWTSQTTDWVEHVDDVVGMGVLIVFWASVWTLIGRVRASHHTFMFHVSAAAAGLVPLTLGQAVLAALHSVSPNAALRAFLVPSWVAVVFAGLVTLHALIIGVPTLRRAAAIGVPLAATLLGAVLVMSAARDARFSGELEIETAIVPLPTALLTTESPERFVQHAEDLKLALDEALASP